MSGIILPRFVRSPFTHSPLIYGGGIRKVAAAASFPVVEDTAPTEVTGTSVSVNLPTGIQAGDILVIATSVNQNRTHSFPVGWTELWDVINTSSHASAAAYRVADGTEGSTITVTMNSDGSLSAIAARISGGTGTPEAATPATGSSANANPPSLAPSPGSAAYLWIAVAAQANADIVWTDPTNYAGGVDASIGVSSVRMTFRQLEASSENPGTFTADTSDAWLAGTIAIQGA